MNTLSWDGLWQWVIRFTVPLFLAESFFVPFIKKRNHFVLRFISSSLLFIVVASLGNYFKLYPSFGWLRTSFIIVFALSLFPLMFSLDAPFKNILFYAMSAYAIQNSVDSFWNMVLIASGTVSVDWIKWTVFSCSYLVFYSAFFFFFVRRIRNGKMSIIHSKVFVLVAVLTLGVTYLLSSYSFLLESKNSISAHIYSIVCCYLLLFLQFGVFQQTSLENEKKLLEQIIAKENEKNRSTKENFNLINIKCHDLKHQIRALRQHVTTDEEKRSLDELENQIMFLDSNVRTGNEALDAVLAEKKLLCERKKIVFSYIVDGEKLSFMDSLDVYSLFGNAIDNAMEALEQAPEDKRVITIAVKEKDHILGIHIENYCPHIIQWEDGLPMTTKGNDDLHGFGTKSIRYIANKYHGNVAFKVENGIFSLNLVFTLKPR